MRLPLPAILASAALAACITISQSTTISSAAQAAGDEFNIKRYEGQVVVLDFWASWCGPCRESFPWMEEMKRRYGDRGLAVVAVNLDEDGEAAKAFLERNSLAGIEKLFDPEGTLAERYGVSAMPFTLLFNSRGEPVYRHAGFHADRTDEYERHLRALLEDDTADSAIRLEAAAGRRIGVHPWERGELAEPEMQLICDPLEIEFDDHVYFSREASSGGRGFGGGGCGCN